MLERLRSLTPDTKKKLSLFLAGFLTLGVFIFWIFSFGGTLVNSVNDATTKGASALSAFQTGVGNAYDKMNKMIPKDFSGMINNNTHTETGESTTTTNMMYDNVSTTTEIK